MNYEFEILINTNHKIMNSITTKIWYYTIPIILYELAEFAAASNPSNNKAHKLAASKSHWQKAIHGLNDYDNTVTPGYAADKDLPTTVFISFYVESIGNFQSTSMGWYNSWSVSGIQNQNAVVSQDFEVDLYLMEYWFDERLAHNRTIPVQSDREDLMAQVWMPDLFIVNSKDARYNEVTRPNRILQIFADGTVRFSVSMLFHNYPFDKQICCIKFMPYGYNESFVTFNWANATRFGLDPIRVNPSIKEFDFVLDRKVYHSYCDGSFAEGNYSCLTAKFILYRTQSHSLLQTYTPTFSIVVISWISFWIDPESVPGRTGLFCAGLCVTTLLTLTTMAAWASRNTPVVSYVKALDVWLTVCLMFLFGSLLEFTAVNFYSRRSNQARLEPGDVRCIAVLNMSDSVYSNHLHRLATEDYKKALRIDRISRLAFPAAFLTFMIFYFTVIYASQPSFADCQSGTFEHLNEGTCQCM